MSHDDVHILVHLAAGLGIASCRSLGVEGMEYRLALHKGQSGISCACHHLVHHNGVCHKGRTSTLASDVVGYKASEVAHVLMVGMMQVVLHLLVYSIHTAMQWLEQSATSNDSVKLQWNASLSQEV